MKGIKKPVIAASFFFLTLWSADSIWSGITGHISGLGIVIFGFSVLSLLLLFILNLLLSISLEQRATHITMMILIIISFTLSRPSNEWRINTLRNSFLTVELPIYESIVTNIIATNINHSVIRRTGEIHPLTKIGRLDISSSIDSDGSSIIYFFDDEDWLHGGYMYYDGHQLISRKDKPEEYSFPDLNGRGFFHITNNWYDFYK